MTYWNNGIAMLAALSAAVGATSCATMQKETTRTITYTNADGIPVTETIVTTEFDQESFEAAILIARELQALALALNEPEERSPEEIEEARQAYELRRAALEAIINRINASSPE